MYFSWERHHRWCGFHNSHVDSCQNCLSTIATQHIPHVCWSISRSSSVRYSHRNMLLTSLCKVSTVKFSQSNKHDLHKQKQYRQQNFQSVLTEGIWKTLLVQKQPRRSAQVLYFSQWHSDSKWNYRLQKSLLSVLTVNMLCLLRCLVNKCFNSSPKGLCWF